MESTFYNITLVLNVRVEQLHGVMQKNVLVLRGCALKCGVKYRDPITQMAQPLEKKNSIERKEQGEQHMVQNVNNW